MRYAIIILAVAALAAVGSFDLLRAARQASPEYAADAQAKLNSIPMTAGPWTGVTGTFNPKMLEQTKVVAHIYRNYTRAGTGEKLDALLIAGVPGEIGAHDPERCYSSAGFKQFGSRLMKTLDAGGSYWSGRFDTETFPAASVQVNWAWSPDGVLNASEDARSEYAMRSMLYKLYVTRSLGSADTKAKTDLTEEFLSEFAPAIRGALAPK